MGTTFSHDNVLSESERITQGEKCVKNLGAHIQKMTPREVSFFAAMRENFKWPNPYAPTMKQLNFLKDLCEKYDR